jgi:hypothetical protein
MRRRYSVNPQQDQLYLRPYSGPPDHPGDGLVRVREFDAVWEGDVDTFRADLSSSDSPRLTKLRPRVARPFCDAAECGFERLSLNDNGPTAIVLP